ITLCGEESFGTGSNHIREKDGLWAVLFWLNLIAARRQSVAEIVQDHWREYGRDYFTRHDYEAIDLASAQQMIARLRGKFAELPGQVFGGLKLTAADDFEYVDPVDKSVSSQQGIRLYFEGGGRVIFRLSGTGTEGATLRVYIDCHMQGPQALDQETQLALAPLIAAAGQIAKIKSHTGRDKPSVIT
ncbi:MAG: alpha-D-glucose phosphate-specific phosphoglucomutase, partial [Gammaproteobacteria bacterium]|nr:alpha-D-glucose phosphate-specific phosphoglucomutase [Gammaproteobacteria bacterium]